MTPLRTSLVGQCGAEARQFAMEVGHMCSVSQSPSFTALPAKRGWKLSTILMAVGTAFFVCCPWVTPARAEIFDGSGFESINWAMRIADAERVVGNGVSRLRENTHGEYEYLRLADY